MRQFILAALTVAAMSTTAAATEWIDCSDATDTVQISVLAGSFTFLNISAATLRVGDEQWSSAEIYGEGLPLSVAQRFQGADQLIIDLADGDYIETIAQLRVYTADEGNDYVQGGVLRVPGRGAWVVSCEGP